MMISDVQDIIQGSETTAPGTDAGAVTVESIMNPEQKKKKPAKRAVETVRKPEGMHRELYNLLVTDKTDATPLVPTLTSHKMGGYKNPKARLGLRTVRGWQLVPFLNPARSDKLVLHHWRRDDKLGDDYVFARFNKVVESPSFSDEEYERLLKVPNWTREETDHLLQLSDRFDLRWVVLQDRWDKAKFGKRSVEDLKERYFSLCNVLIKERAPTDEEPALLHFDADHERRRKEQLEKLWDRSEEQVEEEEKLIRELKKIEARRKERERKAQDLQKLITAADRAPPTPSQPGTPAPSMKKKVSKINRPLPSSSATPEMTTANLKFPEYKGPGPHLRSQRMKLPQQIGQKKLKAVEQALEKLGLESHPIATEEVCTQFNEIRSDLVLLYELKSALASCEFELEAIRHHQLATTGQHVEVPARFRVSNTNAPDTPPRPIVESMDLGSSALPQRRRKATLEQSGVVKRLRK